MKNIKGNIYPFCGTQNGSINLDPLDKMETELAKNHVPHRVDGFLYNHQPSYNERAASNAWLKVTQLFASTLVK